jgi:hypothetical protein
MHSHKKEKYFLKDIFQTKVWKIGKTTPKMIQTIGKEILWDQIMFD